jgi:hypothetical protein
MPARYNETHVAARAAAILFDEGSNAMAYGASVTVNGNRYLAPKPIVDSDKGVLAAAEDLVRVVQRGEKAA